VGAAGRGRRRLRADVHLAARDERCSPSACARRCRRSRTSSASSSTAR
jgi:hypothetical protein